MIRKTARRIDVHSLRRTLRALGGSCYARYSRDLDDYVVEASSAT
jgi:hypothetical protein